LFLIFSYVAKKGWFSTIFEGQYTDASVFFRMDLFVRGLVNPPGGIDPFAFSPFRFGPRPIIGFIEIDMDGDINTGGETFAPGFRYLSNVARFGGNVRRADLRARVALSGDAVDGNLLTPPFIERSGEEFHLAFLGDHIEPGDIHVVVGNNNTQFEAGEVWDVTGPFFHRAHGYEAFSLAEGGGFPGEYIPFSTLRFQHIPIENVTRISLVFPLTNLGAALMRDQPVQTNDEDPTNQASVLEALEDLKLSAEVLRLFPIDDPQAELIVNWADRNPRRGLAISGWRVSALLGTSGETPNANAVDIIWTDLFPNVVRGDVDGSGRADMVDAAHVRGFIDKADSIDGVLDGRVSIPDFATNFVIVDVNYDGVVDRDDLRLADRRGDQDNDGDIDLRDVSRFQLCFGTLGPGDASLACQRMDLTGDNRVDLADLAAFRERIHGPGGP